MYVGVCVCVLGIFFARDHFYSTNLQYAHFNNFFMVCVCFMKICLFLFTNTSSLRWYFFLFCRHACGETWRIFFSAFNYILKFSRLYLNKNFLATSRKENKQKSTHT